MSKSVATPFQGSALVSSTRFWFCASASALALIAAASASPFSRVASACARASARLDSARPRAWVTAISALTFSFSRFCFSVCTSTSACMRSSIDFS